MERAWSKDAVDWAIENKLIEGDTNGDMKLHQPLTREELCVIFKRYDDLQK